MGYLIFGRTSVLWAESPYKMARHRYVGSLTKYVPDILEIRRCVRKKKIKLHISENVVAYRVPANFSIYAKKHHHYTVIYFLTDLQKVSSLENHITSKSAFATSHELVFCRESNGK